MKTVATLTEDADAPGAGDAARMLLVLDLDETLIHAREAPLSRYLATLADVPDVRRLGKRGWRTAGS